jgi:glycolate oxidase
VNAPKGSAALEAARQGSEQQFLTLQELVAAAKSNLPPGPWSYLIGGAETETTVKRNRHALDCIVPAARAARCQ